ncbi:unnamed protein product [Peniophora sp. CBMAI 1063]|nr:unnamed protein product [Peniophora sp. CBMAI 1063]
MFPSRQFIQHAVQAILILVTATLTTFAVRGAYARHVRRRALRSVRGPPNPSFFTGNLPDLYSATGLPSFNALSQYGRVTKVHGLFGDVILVITDPSALADVLIKNVTTFPAIDISGSLDLMRYLFGPGLIASNGPEHRRQRKLLNPSFSSAQIKRLAPLVQDVAFQLRAALSEQVARDAHEEREPEREVELEGLLGSAALDMISRAAFGHSWSAMEGDGGEYVRAVKDLSPVLGALGSVVPIFILSGGAHLPSGVLRLAGAAISLISPSLRHLLHIEAVYRREIQAVVSKARNAWRNESSQPSLDLLGALFDAGDTGRASDEEICAQASTLVFGGTETTSTILCRILHQLALDPSLQDRLREEIMDARRSQEGGEESLSYDGLMALPLLDAVCKETLRVFAPLPFRNRHSVRESVLSLSDGTSLYVPKGTEILVNIHGVNMDEEIWGSDAQVWRPRRWLDPLPTSLLKAKVPGLYSHLLTFAGGIKGCIGFNFSIMEMKTVLATLVPAFAFSLSTEHEIEWKFASLITPGIKGGTDLHPGMPLRVKLLADE